MISVIVPIYNVEKYIVKAVLSVLNQTYKSFELILIDDGSNDLCAKLCNELSKKDRRIKVIHKYNKGVSNTRNIGLKLMKGDKYFFLDGDDYIEYDSLDRLLYTMNHSNADIVKCGIINENENGIIDCEKNSKIEGLIDLKNKAIDLSTKYDYAPVWGKLFRKSNNNIVFDETIHYAEDYLYVIEQLLKSNYLYITNEKLYHSVTRKGSIVNGEYGYKRFTELKAYNKITHLVEDYYVSKIEISSILTELIFYHRKNIVKTNLILNSEDENILNKLSKKNIPSFKNSKFKIKFRIVYYIMVYFPKLFEELVIFEII